MRKKKFTLIEQSGEANWQIARMPGGLKTCWKKQGSESWSTDWNLSAKAGGMPQDTNQVQTETVGEWRQK